MTYLFSFFTGTGTPYYFPGASFLAAAVFELAALGSFLVSRWKVSGGLKFRAPNI